MNPQKFVREGLQSTPEMAEIYSNLIERSQQDSLSNYYFTKLLENVLEEYFNVEQFKYLLTKLAIVVNWDDEQRSLINKLLTQYDLPQVL